MAGGVLFLILLHFASLATPETLTFNWNVGWVTAAPDGYERPVIGVNGQWPWPIMECNVNDTLVVNVNNNLGNETTSLHHHGIYQYGTNTMDGVTQVHQCSIPNGRSYTYTFTAYPSGTRWYHSHDQSQYPDGFRAPMIIHDPEWEASLGFDEQFTFSVSDWYHEQMPKLITEYLDGDTWGTDDVDDQMPMAASTLINDTTSITINIQPNKKYLIRMVSVAAYFAHTISFEDHEMTIVAVDGQPVKATTASAIRIASGQRYDVLITGMSKPTRNYAITSIMEGTELQAKGLLSYCKSCFSIPLPLRAVTQTPIDDTMLENALGMKLLSPVTRSITLPVNYTLVNHRRIIIFGDDTYVPPKVPTLYTALTTGKNALNPIIYGPGVNPYILQSGEVVQIVVENNDNSEHPMHLHGYSFQVIARGTGTWDGSESSLPQYPVVRDVVTTPSSGYLVIRFKADNPGVWMYHCHMVSHLAAGMMVTLIESPDILQSSLMVDQQALALCQEQMIATAGNCAGNTVNVFDIRGCNNNLEAENGTALTSHNGSVNFLKFE